MLDFPHKPQLLSAWLDSDRAHSLESSWFNGMRGFETNGEKDESSSPSYLEDELSRVRELVTLKQASSGVLERWEGDAVN